MQSQSSPLGTANAYYYHLFPPESPSCSSTAPASTLYSLLSFLHSHPSQQSLRSLDIAFNQLPRPSKVFTFVVSSAALHASILHDAESLRATIPGVDRFKVAAQQNATNWSKGRLTLLPCSHRDAKVGGGVTVDQYDSRSRSLLPVPSQESNNSVILQGPFAYLASSLVSRFESNFLVAPFRSPSSPLHPDPSSPSLDIVLVRPLRDTTTSSLVRAEKDKEAKEGFVATLWNALGGMYRGGVHVDEKFEGREETVVEYFRCGGFVWEPVSRSFALIFDGT